MRKHKIAKNPEKKRKKTSQPSIASDGGDRHSDVKKTGKEVTEKSHPVVDAIKDDNQSKSLQNAATGASWSIILQIMLRLVTFASNGIIVRMSSKDMLGVVNVRLLLLYSSTVFLSREPVRKACLSVRHTQLTPHHWQMVVNLIWIGVFASVVIAFLLSFVWLFFLQKPKDMEYYTVAVLCYALSAIVEVAAEPFWIFYQIKLNSKLKAVIESQSLIAGVVVLLSGLYFFPTLGLLVPSAAQLVRKLYILLSYARKLHLDLNTAKATIAPIQSSKQMLFSSSTSGVVWFHHYPVSIADIAISFVKHGIVKQLLTEGERYIMTFSHILSFAEQGIYDVVSSLGSLIPRMLFHPIEEDYYTFFAALLSREEETDEVIHNIKSKTTKVQDIKKIVGKNDEQLASLTLATLLKLVVLIGVIFTCFGQAYSYLLLFLYGGEGLANVDGVILLRATSVYVLLLAINGITECFVAAFSSKREIDEHNWWMLLFSFVYVGASIFFTVQFGALGFVMANSINMVLRFSKSIYDIFRYAHHHPHMLEAGNPIVSSIPNISVLLVLFISMGVTLWSEKVLIGDTWKTSIEGVPLLNILQHIVVGVVTFASSMLIIYLKEREFLFNLKMLWKGGNTKSKKKHDKKTQ
eukprot:m.28986 g.28986  ORF g.28986 m.28986 type:complete len:635 (-) comp6112_c0_seq1:183-2087(-)